MRSTVFFKKTFYKSLTCAITLLGCRSRTSEDSNLGQAQNKDDGYYSVFKGQADQLSDGDIPLLRK